MSKPPAKTKSLKDLIDFKLFPYQDEIKNLVLKAIKDGHKKIILQLAGGAGKTKLSLQLMSELEEMGKTSVFTTPRINLSFQTWSEYPQALGYMQGSKIKNAYSKVWVANINTLVNREVYFDVTIHDEIHMITSTNNRYENTDIKIGLSASPYNPKGGKLKGWEDAYIIEHSFNEAYLTSIGRLTPLTYYTSSHKLDSLRVKNRGENGSIDKESEERATEEIVNVIDSLEKDFGREHFLSTSTLVIAQNIEHCNELSKEFKEKGYKVGVMHNKVKNPLQVLEDFKKKEVTVLVAVDMVSVGTDVPHLVNVVLARVFGSHTLYRQAVWRGTRVYPNKDKFFVFDFGSNLERLGNPMLHPTNKEKPTKAEPKGCDNCGCTKPKELVQEFIDVEEMVKVRRVKCRECGELYVVAKEIPSVECCECGENIMIADGRREGNIMIVTCSSGHTTKIATIVSTPLLATLTDSRKVVTERLDRELEEFIIFSSTSQLSYLYDVLTDSFSRYTEESIIKLLSRAKAFGANKTDKLGSRARETLKFILSREILKEERYNSLLEVLEDNLSLEEFFIRFRNLNRITSRKVLNFIKANSKQKK